jgi:putative transposase
MAIDPKVIDKLLAEYETPEYIIGENGLLRQLTKALVERALQAELTTHLGYEKHSVEGHNSGNSRNGESRKRLKGDFGTLEIAVPRDREASFEPKLVPKGTTRFAGFDDKILSLYARGMTTREIQGHLEEMYQVEVSPTLISNVTEAVIEEVKAWQSRPVDEVYPIVYLDALVVKMRCDGRVENRAVYVAIGMTMEGGKEVLGVDLGQRGSEVLAASVDRVAEPRAEGYFHCLRGWAEGLSAGHRWRTARLPRPPHFPFQIQHRKGRRSRPNTRAWLLCSAR